MCVPLAKPLETEHIHSVIAPGRTRLKIRPKMRYRKLKVLKNCKLGKMTRLTWVTRQTRQTRQTRLTRLTRLTRQIFPPDRI